MDDKPTNSPESDARPHFDPRYSVVGCRRCQSYWLVENLDTHDQVQCANCGALWQADHLDPRAQADDPDVARELRARILADQAGESDRYATVDDYGVLEEQVSDYFDQQETLFDADADTQLDEHRQQFEALADAYLEEKSQRFEPAAEAYLARRDRWLETEAEAVLGRDNQRYADAVTEEVDQDIFDVDLEGFLDQDDEGCWESCLIPWWSPFWTPVPTPGTPDTTEETLVAIAEDTDVDDTPNELSTTRPRKSSDKQVGRIPPIVQPHFDAIEGTELPKTTSVQIGPLPPVVGGSQATLRGK